MNMVDNYFIDAFCDIDFGYALRNKDNRNIKSSTSNKQFSYY